MKPEIQHKILSYQEGGHMWSRKIFFSAIFVCLVLLSFAIGSSRAADTTDQILTQVDDILNANPLKAGR